MSVKLKILTLNCWGVPVPVFGSKLRHERMLAIGNELAKSQYDFVLLQEIWSEADYQTLCAKILTVMPYAHYFHSGVIGSGLCIFSRHPILETQGFPFTLNGYAHKIFHCDWYGRKAVGLAKLLIQGVRVNVYMTHLHADYSACKNAYQGHRISQAFEMSQHIKNTSEGCDVVIVGGDLNYKPEDTGYSVIRHNASLKDAWLSQRRKVEDDTEGYTSDRHDNSFNAPSQHRGQRIDHLLYRNNAGYTMDCETCQLTMRLVPGENYNYSDHEGVMAEFIIKKNITGMGVQRDAGEIEKHLTDALIILDRGMQKVTSDRVFFVISMFLCFVALVFTCDVAESWTLGGAVIGVARTGLTLAIGFFFWMGLVQARVELAGLIATKSDVNNLLKSNPA